MTSLEIDLKNRYESIQDRIEKACQKAGRKNDSVILTAVSKTKKAELIQILYSFGQRNFGENRIDEANSKMPELPSDIDWNMIGHLQSNKSKECLNFSMIQSLDTSKTALLLEKFLSRINKIMPVLLEIHTTEEESKNGIKTQKELEIILETLETSCPHLQIKGLMTMAPLTNDAHLIRQSFRQLKILQTKLLGSCLKLDLSILSMGMSGDFELAIEEGSTLVRIGTALFGDR